MAVLREAKQKDLGRRLLNCRALYQLQALGEVVRRHYASTTADRTRNARGLAQLQHTFDAVRMALSTAPRT
jgi:hypothetical protein